MGFKRPFDDEEFQEFTLKHPKQVDCGNKLTSFSESYPCYEATQKAEIPGEEIFCKFRLGDGLERDSRNVVSDLVDKEFETTPLSLVTSSSSDEDAGSAATVCSSLYPEYFEFYIPRRPLFQFEDSYSSLLEGPPKKQVPIGPNHQAEVPVWDPEMKETYSSGSDNVGDAYGGELMGDRVLLMLDFSADSGLNAGDGRKDCLCADQGSVRCVRQHVREARERIREILGYEKFVLLGFCDMGEEVSLKWTEEEEVIFHDVVYSNPVSRGKNFWEYLSMVFPSRMKKEIVSYYFNVFMLRRRAIQNRSHVLDIDSDDDEWNGSDEGPFGVAGEDEEAAIECLVSQHAQLDYEDDSPDDDEHDGDEDDYEGDADDRVGNCDPGKGGGHTVENVGGRSRSPMAQIGMSLQDCRSEFVVHPAGKILGCEGVNFDAQNLSRVSFEGQPNAVDSFGSSDGRAAAQDSSVKGGHKDGDLYGNNDGLVASYLSESCDAKDWRSTYPINSLKGVDLLPTGNMIEEIFGPVTQNSKSSNEKSSS